LLRAVIDHIDTGLIISDPRGRILEMNPVARELCGYASPGQARRHAAEAWKLFTLQEIGGAPVAEGDWPRERARRGETFNNWILRVLRKDQGCEWIGAFGGASIQDATGHAVCSIVTMRDVTERWRAQEELERKVRERTADLDRFNRTLQAIVDCNQAIIRARSERDLFHEFCRICMRVEGIGQAWAGLAEEGNPKVLRPVAAVGFHRKDLDRARFCSGQGPAMRAVANGKACLQPEPPEAPALFIEREEDLGLGFGATLALPLRSGGPVFGALVLCSIDPAFFDPPQVRMLQELANNLSIGVRTLRTQVERDRALKAADDHAEQVRAMSLELARAEQRERRRLAQVLHDHLQQLLVGASFGAEALKGKLRGRSLREAAALLSETIGEALEVSRNMTLELSPPIFHEKGLTAGLEWLASQMHRKHGLEVALDVLGDVDSAAEQIRVFLFEAVRELLLNIVKHARVDHARVRLRGLGEDGIELTVADQGDGFDAARVQESGASGYGLFNLRERLRFLHGRMRIESAKGQGSRFTLVVPHGSKEAGCQSGS
ncbi:MAG TPA: ATP-binding protein, partial [Holophaga sp.]|nr:ATP-binding protein [Holophaga sp.]